MAFGTRVRTLGGNKSSINLDELVDGSKNIKTVRDGKTIQSMTESITDASDTNPYMVIAPPGVHSVAEKIDLPEYVDLIGSGKSRATLQLASATPSAAVEINYDRTLVEKLKIQANYAWDVDLVSILESRDSIIRDLILQISAGYGIVINHSGSLVSKCLYINNIKTSALRQSAIANIGTGYARAYISGANIGTAMAFPAAHGIEGNFIGSIKSVRMAGTGGDHFHITSSQQGLNISDCHLEQAVSGVCISLENCRSVVIKNVAMWTMPSCPMDFAVKLVNCQDCVVEGCFVNASSGSASHVSFSADGGSKRNVFKNNRTDNLTGSQKKYDISGGNGNIIDDKGETVTTGTVDLQHWSYSELDSSGGAITGTLPDGIFPGQRKTIVMTDATTSSTVTATHHVTSHPEIATFNAVDETWILEWTGTEWVTIYNTCTFT